VRDKHGSMQAAFLFFLVTVLIELSRHFRFGHPRSVTSYDSETARESNFFAALVAHHDTRMYRNIQNGLLLYVSDNLTTVIFKD
jgi:hypothetical protein